MPPPPPPPPVPGGLGPRGPPPKLGGGSNARDHNALLSDIRGGARLKKTVTNDRSAPVVGGKAKPSTNGSYTGDGGSVGGGGSKGGGGMMNGGAPQLGGLFAGGMPKLKPTSRGINTNSNVSSGPLLPPGRKPAPSVPQTTLSSDVNSSSANDMPPASPKPSIKSNPAPPPPPAARKPTFPSDKTAAARGPLPEPPSPLSKPKSNDINANQPTPYRSGHPTLPSKNNLVVKPSVGNKPAPPRPPNTSKPLPPPKSPGVQPNGSAHFHSNRPVTRTSSMRDSRNSIECEATNENVENLLSSTMSRTLPASHHNRNLGESALSPGQRAVTVGRAGGALMAKSITRAPTERPPPPPTRPSVAAPPPPSQPPPPPPHRPGVSSSSKPEPPSTAPPQPPSRISSRQSGSDFESKFQFHPAQDFPFPFTYENCTKTYPSKNARPASQRRAPPPPPGPLPSSNSGSNTALSASNSSLRFHSHTSPPPPPPHAPLHLQVGTKMYGTEASHC